MTDEQRAALRRLRGARSLRTFADLAAGGMTKPLSRQRLSRVEQGTADLTPAEWEALADALLLAGHTVAEVAVLRPGSSVIEAAPPAAAALRLRQWSRVVDHLPGNRWWQHPTSLMERVAGRERAHHYSELTERHGIDLEQQRKEIRRRLAHGVKVAGTLTVDSSDAVAVAETSELSAATGAVELFVLNAKLHNAGSVFWRDRLLYRLGPPVTSSLPFTPAVLPVPDTAPGRDCEILIPGRSQWFPSLAIVSYVMVFPDCSPCLPGRLRCLVDTRKHGHFDHTLPMPPRHGTPGPPKY